MRNVFVTQAVRPLSRMGICSASFAARCIASGRDSCCDNRPAPGMRPWTLFRNFMRTARASAVSLMHMYSRVPRSEEHTSELQSLMRISYAVFCLKKKNHLTRLDIVENITHLNINNVHQSY